MLTRIEVSDGVESLLLLGKAVANGPTESHELSEEIKPKSPPEKRISDSSARGDPMKQDQCNPSQSPLQKAETSHKLPAKLMTKKQRKGEEPKKNIVNKSTCLSDKMAEFQNDSLRPLTTAGTISSLSDRKSRHEVSRAKVEKGPLGTSVTHAFQLSGTKRKRLGMIDSTELKKNMLHTLAARQEQLQRNTQKSPAVLGDSLQQVSIMIESAKAAITPFSEREIIRRALRARRDTAFLDSMNAVGVGAANFTVAQACAANFTPNQVWRDQNLAPQLSSVLSAKHFAPLCKETKLFPTMRTLADIAYDYTHHREPKLVNPSQKFHSI